MAENLQSHFFQFLQSVGLDKVIQSNPNDTLEQLIITNYHYFDTNIMKLLINYAIQQQQQTTTGTTSQTNIDTWSIIIDLFKNITMNKRNKASEMMQKLCQIGYENGPDGIVQYIEKLRTDQCIDSVFIDLVSTSYEDCQAMNGSRDILQILKFIQLQLQPEREYYENIKSNQSTPPPPPPTTTMTMTMSNTTTNSGQGTGCSGSGTSTSADDENYNQNELITAGEILQQTILSCQGDAKKLKLVILENLRSNPPPPISMSSKAFLKVLNDNIVACHQAEYYNKAKLFQFIKQIIKEEMKKSTETSQGGSSIPTNEGEVEEDITGAKYGLNVYHAPQFVEHKNDEIYGDVEVTLVDETDGYVDALKVSDALVYTATGTSTKTKKMNKKKKNIKNDAIKKVHSLVDHLGQHLETYGWAVCDHTIPEDIVRRVRIEASLFTNFYEQSEIWVGKQADIGAHVVVPSVRGDKVLWMCGGHLHKASPEGLTRTIKTHGEIEPCRLEVKNQAPIRRFAAMKELVLSVDKLIFELKERCPTLSGLYERSDAMLSIYPGNGARFAKHIDNTTQDGRKITVLCYLNPDWDDTMGGALRLFIPKKFRLKEDEDIVKGTAPATTTAATPESSDSSNGIGMKEEATGGDNDDTNGYHMKAVDVYPHGGRLAIFYSSEIPHEVLPTYGNRHALTIWYYDTTERKQTIERAKESGKGIAASKASLETQQLAQQFIAKLMSQCDVKNDQNLLVDPTEEELQSLQKEVKNLNDDVIEIISNITGAPSIQSFRDGFEMLTIYDLKQMRELFTRMGLGSYQVVSSGTGASAAGGAGGSG